MKSVFLSAGHGGTDPGATTTVKGVDGRSTLRREADIGVEFRNMVAYYLTQAGVKFETDGKDTENLPLREAVKKAAKHPIGVEFHCNAGPVTATGIETLSGPKDMKLGADICAALYGAWGLRNRGAKPEDSGQHHRLAFVQAGGIIVEMFFISNPNDLAVYDQKKWLGAKAVAEVLIKAAKA